MAIDWESPSQRRALAELIDAEEYSRRWAKYRETAGKHVAERWIGVLSLIELQWLGHIVDEPGRSYRAAWPEQSLAERHLIQVYEGKCTATPAGLWLLKIERERWRTKHDSKNRKA